MGFKQKIAQLLVKCNETEKALVEHMVISAADYISKVVVMEATAMNITNRQGDEQRLAVAETDTVRHTAHDALIAHTNIVNRICANHRLPPLYSGSDHRREYGDFALQLTIEFFEKRR